MDHLNDDIREELQQELTTRELQNIESALHREYVRKPDVQAEWEKLMLSEKLQVRSDKLEPSQKSDSSTSGNHTSQFSTINSQLKNTSHLRSSHLWSFLSGVAAAAVIFTAELTTMGKQYLYDNPHLRNPIDWKWIVTTALAAIAAAAAVAALFVACTRA